MSLKTRVGIVVNNRTNKTAVVKVETRISHAKYAKVIAKTKRYKVHDEENLCRVGDQILIQETKPISKTKQWQIKTILVKASKLDIKEEGI
uniref:Small ribosomal subunit protein uS17c n=1 Tax=Sciadococcus taiwanensis TaxID=3028030 RepID=A0A9Y1I2D0_9RHOD|nr:ribosomal protein S17 [Sciadococcus taiwanensis]